MYSCNITVVNTMLHKKVQIQLTNPFDPDFKICCSISINNISKVSVSQLSPNDHLMAVIQNSTIEYRYPGYRDLRIIALLLLIIILPERSSIITRNFIIPVFNSITLKMPIILWGYKFDPFLLMSDFKLTNLTKTKSNFTISELPPVTDSLSD